MRSEVAMRLEETLMMETSCTTAAWQLSYLGQRICFEEYCLPQLSKLAIKHISMEKQQSAQLLIPWHERASKLPEP